MKMGQKSDKPLKHNSNTLVIKVQWFCCIVFPPVSMDNSSSTICLAKYLYWMINMHLNFVVEYFLPDNVVGVK